MARTWEPLPPCSDCTEIVAQLNRRMPQVYQSFSGERVHCDVFYPDANAERIGVDGWASRGFGGSTWAEIRDGVGTDSDAVDTDFELKITSQVGASPPKWNEMTRIFMAMRVTDLIPATATLLAGGITMQCVLITNNLLLASGEVGITSAAMSSGVAIVDADYQSFGSTELATRAPLPLTNYLNYKWRFNQAGLDYISGQIAAEDFCYFCFRTSFDLDNEEPPYVSAQSYIATYTSADNATLKNRRIPTMQLTWLDND